MTSLPVFRQTFAHHGPTESRFFARARATNGLGTFSGLLWKVLRGFKNISRGPWEIMAIKASQGEA